MVTSSATAVPVAPWVPGAACAAAALMLVFASSADAGGDPLPVAATIGACAIAVVVGRAIGAIDRAIVPAAVVVIAVGLVVAEPEVRLSARDSAGWLGYTNANAAFFVQATAAAAMLIALRKSWLVRVAAGSAMALFLVVSVANRSAAGALLSLLVVVLVLAAAEGVSPRRLRMLVMWLFIIALAGTVVLGAMKDRVLAVPGAEEVAERSISTTRLGLWSDALALMEAHPLTGVGPGNFAETSPIARTDPDTRWAHNGFLQVGAEIGSIAMAVMIVAFLWGFAWVGREPADAAAIIGTAAVAVLGIHASIDYILHFAAVPVTCAVLAGSAAARPDRLRATEE